MVLDELVAEGGKVFVKARRGAIHSGEVDGVSPTYNEVEIPFAICYTIRKYRIIEFWTISDQQEFLKQIGVASKEEALLH